MPASSWQERTELEVLLTQLRALDVWRQTAVVVDVERTLVSSREARLTINRQMEARRAEQAALVRRSEEQLRAGRSLLAGRRRAVVAHRNEWFRGKVSGVLEARGIEVTASVADGAEAVAVIVLEQPDLILVEDLLPVVSGAEVVQRASKCAPDALIGVQVDRSDTITALLDAGARAVFTRRIPPAEVAAALIDCLDGKEQALTVL
jgi:CheY-like chemotaxis protein